MPGSIPTLGRGVEGIYLYYSYGASWRRDRSKSIQQHILVIHHFVFMNFHIYTVKGLLKPLTTIVAIFH